MMTLSRKKKHSLRKKNSGTKKRSYKKTSSISLENLKKEIETNILEKLKHNSLESENKQKSGHVEAGKKWKESAAGKEWENDINKSKEILVDILKKRGYSDISINGRYPRILGGKIRDYEENPEIGKNPMQSAEEIADQIIEEYKTKSVKKIKQTKQPKQVEQDFSTFKAPEPISVTPLYPTESQNQTKIIGGFFDDSSDEEDQL
jgi:hypothetical protein